MQIVIVILLLVVMGFAGVMLLAGADREKISTTRRLKVLSAPPPTTVTGDLVNTNRGDPWIKYIPERWRGRVDDAVGATGYKVKLRTMLIIGVVFGLSIWIGAILLGFPRSLAVIIGLAGAYLPNWLWLRRMQRRHTDSFLNMFPDAIDLIVRAVRAGLPVTAAIEAAGRETPDPVGGEFKLIAADLRIGLDLDEALRRANGRVRMADFSFFVASLILQRESGGNLSETLSILSAVLRRRAELRLKVAAMTSEARTSAMIIGALPFFSGGALLVFKPDYLHLFVTNPNGPLIIGIAVAMLTMGFLTMRSMIQSATR